MTSKRCSDVVESRVEQAILDAESRRDAAQIRNSPGALALNARELLTTTRCDEPTLSIDQFGDLSINRIIATGELAGAIKIDNKIVCDAKACPEPVEWVGPMTKRLSELYAQRTATEGVQVVEKDRTRRDRI